MVICLERGADLHMAQLMPLPLTVSCSSKIQIGFTFLVPAHLGSPGQRAVKGVCVCVCVCVCLSLCMLTPVCQCSVSVMLVMLVPVCVGSGARAVECYQVRAVWATDGWTAHSDLRAYVGGCARRLSEERSHHHHQQQRCGSRLGATDHWLTLPAQPASDEVTWLRILRSVSLLAVTRLY